MRFHGNKIRIPIGRPTSPTKLSMAMREVFRGEFPTLDRPTVVCCLTLA